MLTLIVSKCTIYSTMARIFMYGLKKKIIRILLKNVEFITSFEIKS